MAAVYTLNSTGTSGANKRQNVVTIAYTTETYSSGLSVDKAQLGCPVIIESLAIVSDSAGAGTDIVKYDAANQKIRIYAETAGTYAEVSAAQTRTIVVYALGY